MSDTQGYVSFKQNLEGRVLLFEATVSNDQVLRCQPYSDHSVCQIVPAFVISKTGDTTRFSTRINDAKDDAEENNDLINLYNSQLNLEQDTLVGLRFNVHMPSDAVITKAYLELTALEAQSETTTLMIAAQDTGNAEVFSATKNLTQRKKFSTQISWKTASWNTNQTIISPDLSDLIKEVISHPDWQSGQALSLFITSSGLRVRQGF